MPTPRLRSFLLLCSLAFSGLCIAAEPASDDPRQARLFIDPAGQAQFRPPAGWTPLSTAEAQGKRFFFYSYALPGVKGARAVARVSLKPVSRSVRLADLTPEEQKAAEHASSAAIEDMQREVDAMPGLDFLAGGTQYIYTALEDGQRFHYSQFINVKGVTREDQALRPAVAIGLRCRNAVAEGAPGAARAAEALEASCYQTMLGLQTR